VPVISLLVKGRGGGGLSPTHNVSFFLEGDGLMPFLLPSFFLGVKNKREGIANSPTARLGCEVLFLYSRVKERRGGGEGKRKRARPFFIRKNSFLYPYASLHGGKRRGEKGEEENWRPPGLLQAWSTFTALGVKGKKGVLAFSKSYLALLMREERKGEREEESSAGANRAERDVFRFRQKLLGKKEKVGDRRH